MATEYIHELGDSLSTGASSAGPHVKVIAPEKYKESGSETYKTISVEIDSKYTKPSGGIPKSDLAGAVQTSLVNNVTLGNSKALAITMPYTLRTGRSTALVLVSGNNAKYCLMEIGWFKAASTAIASNRIYSHVLACYDTAQDCVPKVYITYGASGVDSVIYLVLSNSSSGSEWATQMSVMLNCENAGSVSIGAVDSSVATSATDVSGGTVYNVDSRNVLGSSSSSSWSGDNTNIPTRGAVEEKILATISGNVGGFLGAWVPSNVYNYQTLGGHDYRTGDYVAITEDGTVIYYENNNRSGSTTSLTVSEGNEIYWTTSGKFEIMPSNSLQVYNYSTLSDWNDITVPGLYQISVSNATNAPASGTYSCLVSNVSGNIRQVAMSGTNIYYRGKGLQSGWTDWRSVADADTAANYTPSGGIATALAAKQDFVYWTSPYGGTMSNPGADKSYVDGITRNDWMYAYQGDYIKYRTATATATASGTYADLDDAMVIAGNTERIMVYTTAGFNFSPGYTSVTSGRKQYKQYVRYMLTVANMSNSSITFEITAGRACPPNLSPSPNNCFWGIILKDGLRQATPFDTFPNTWDSNYVNKVTIGQISAQQSMTWEIWWFDYVDPNNPTGYHIHNVFVTTLK